ncbi:collagen alpha-2(V) chain-like [Carcharodon carcharias]|uniref:collagen alpha-2(V) chain-like n=1 Tax=Carcharodon carcharias TaxID=13397 RepID=UPI001B7EDFF4|nr:collagen alpha-2(V) chain-like [Carcharodon carcharias]XP_041035461.1 collagen alpha-2(V) chain-like [Carcharodon carcharias]
MKWGLLAVLAGCVWGLVRCGARPRDTQQRLVGWRAPLTPRVAGRPPTPGPTWKLPEEAGPRPGRLKKTPEATPSPRVTKVSGTCAVGGILLYEGALWSPQPCMLCACEEGRAVCEVIECPPTPCRRVHTPQGRCCPVCQSDATRGGINGQGVEVALTGSHERPQVNNKEGKREPKSQRTSRHGKAMGSARGSNQRPTSPPWARGRKPEKSTKKRALGVEKQAWPKSPKLGHQQPETAIRPRGSVSKTREVGPGKQGVVTESGPAKPAAGLAKPQPGLVKPKLGSWKQQAGLKLLEAGLKKAEVGLKKLEKSLSKPELGLKLETGLKKLEAGLKNQEKGLNKPEVGLKQETGLNKPEVGLKQEKSLNKPEVGLKQETGLNKPEVGLKQEKGLNKPEVGLKQEKGLNKPEVGLKQETGLNKPEVGLKQEKGLNKPEVGLKQETGLNKPEVGLKQEKGLNKPEVGLKQEKGLNKPEVGLKQEKGLNKPEVGLKQEKGLNKPEVGLKQEKGLNKPEVGLKQEKGLNKPEVGLKQEKGLNKPEVGLKQEKGLNKPEVGLKQEKGLNKPEVGLKQEKGLNKPEVGLKQEKGLNKPEVGLKQEKGLNKPEVGLKQEKGLNKPEVGLKQEKGLNKPEIGLKQEKGLNKPEVGLKQEKGRNKPEVGLKQEKGLNKPEVGLKQEKGLKKPEVGLKQEIGPKKAEVGLKISEVGLKKPILGLKTPGMVTEVGLKKQEIGLKKSEVGLKKPKVGLKTPGVVTEVGLKKAEVGLKKAAVGLKKAAVGLKKAEVGLKKAKVNRQGSGVVADAGSTKQGEAGKKQEAARNVGKEAAPKGQKLATEALGGEGARAHESTPTKQAAGPGKGLTARLRPDGGDEVPAAAGKTPGKSPSAKEPRPASKADAAGATSAPFPQELLPPPESQFNMPSLPVGCILAESAIACPLAKLIEIPRLADPGLLTLYLADNGITRVSASHFAGLPNLQWLDLSRNKISDRGLDRDAFQNLTKLRRLHLDGNRIHRLPILPLSLDDLKLNDNRLEALDRSSFRGLHCLLTLELEGNELNDGNFNPNAFRPLKKLIYLRLGRNRFRAMPSGLPPSLRELHLENNHIEEIPGGLLNKTLDLTTVVLRHNRLQENRIAPQAWIHLRKLENLDLSHNRLVHVPSFLPVGLKQLLLHHNQIERIPGYVFAHLQPGLEFLHLSYNQLRNEGIHTVSFLGLYTSLQELLLDHNQLSAVPQGILNLRVLQVLQLSDNQIRYVPLDSVCDTRISEDSNLVSVHLENNLIDRRLIPPTAFSCIQSYQSVRLRPQRFED